MAIKDEWGEVSAKKKLEDDKIEIELEENQEEEKDSKPEIELEEDNDQEDKAADTKKKDDELKELEGIETNGAQKRIRRLVAQRKEREAENAELQKRIAEYERKLKEKDEEVVSSAKKNLDQSEQSVSSQLQLAEDAYKQALENGDSGQIVEAQKKLYSATIQMDRITQAKEAYAEMTPKEQEQVKQDIKQANQQQQPPVPERPYAPDPSQFNSKAVAWAQNNEKFGTDQIFTATAIALNNKLVEEGWDADDDEFYEEIDNQLKQQLPMYYKTQESAKAPVEEDEQPEVKAPQQPSQVVAGASRTVSNPATGRNRKVKLTREDQEIAKKWGMSLEDYAAQKLAIEASGEGEYTQINIKRGGQ